VASLSRTDFTKLVVYIAEASPDAAYRVHDEIRRQTGMLASPPDIGRLGRVSSAPELVITGTPYIAADRVTRNVVRVLRLLNGARCWPVDL
jgi:plasmid stabilization system protein ParE